VFLRLGRDETGCERANRNQDVPQEAQLHTSILTRKQSPPPSLSELIIEPNPKPSQFTLSPMVLISRHRAGAHKAGNAAPFAALLSHADRYRERKDYSSSSGREDRVTLGHRQIACNALSLRDWRRTGTTWNGP